MSPRDFKLPTPVGKAVKKFSKFLGIQRTTSTHARLVGQSPLTGVPVDVVEEILLCLSGQYIVRMQQV
jgi:hypothetical protein